MKITVKQISKIIKDLPDPLKWPDDQYTASYKYERDEERDFMGQKADGLYITFYKSSDGKQWFMHM